MTALRSRITRLLERRRRGRVGHIPERARTWAERFPTDTTPAPQLRPYQVEFARAVLRSVAAGDGLSFSLMVSRQGGKNELSAQLELQLLIASATSAVDAIKTAPTLRPQLLTSLMRVRQRAADVGVKARREGDAVSVGRARLVALSGSPDANVAGATAGLLLECDEAQDVDGEVWNRQFRPMASSTNATTVYYGTAWTETDLLWQVRETHIEQERRDGIRRHFEFDWQEVAKYNPAYAGFVAGERDRLGEGHPLFTTQYLLRPLPGAGRMFTPAQRQSLEGAHARRPGPSPDDHAQGRLIGYVAGLDVGGEALTATARPDWTVLTIARVLAPSRLLPDQLPHVEVVDIRAWQGAPHPGLVGELALILGTWRPRRVVVDATGVGEGLAASLAATVRGVEVERLRLTEQRKSELGYGLVAAASGRLRLFAGDDSEERRQLAHQVLVARVEYKPNRLMHWSVAEADGHDDHLMSLALCVTAAHDLTLRSARGHDR